MFRLFSVRCVQQCNNSNDYYVHNVMQWIFGFISDEMVKTNDSVLSLVGRLNVVIPFSVDFGKYRENELPLNNTLNSKHFCQ